MNDLEDQLMSELYFVISYRELVGSIPWTNSLKETLVLLLQKRWVDQLFFDQSVGDFIKKSEPDTSQLEPYSYLATKKGLLEHSGF